MIMLWKSFSPFVIIFFVTMVFIGAYFILNLTLAVIKYSFTVIMEKFRDDEKENLESEEDSDSSQSKEDDEEDFLTTRA